MKITATASYRAVPFMLIVAPKGSTKPATRSDTPAASAHWMVTGNVADELSVLRAVSSAGAWV